MGKGFSSAEFKAKLAKIPKAVLAEVNKANGQNAEEWASLARRAAPQDPADGTPLHDSIRTHVSDTGGHVVRAGGATTRKTTPAGTYDYARAMEFGTEDQPAHPFFWPTYRLLRRRMNSRRRRALKKAMKEV